MRCLFVAAFSAADKEVLVHPESIIAVSFVVMSVKDGVKSKDSAK
jgi:hypothetical protein